MKLREIVEQLSLQVCAGQQCLEREVTGGYASDLLSCVMAGAKRGNIWVTLQAHPNVVAVAALLELSAIVITEGVQPETATLQKAQAEGVPILTTRHTTFTVVAKLSRLGIRGADEEKA